jgi:hypothetical protein
MSSNRELKRLKFGVYLMEIYWFIDSISTKNIPNNQTFTLVIRILRLNISYLCANKVIVPKYYETTSNRIEREE